MKTTGKIVLRVLSLLATGLLATTGVANAGIVYDIGTAAPGGAVTFDATCDTLTNTTGITALDSTTLTFNDGSDLSGVDFTALGITSWDSGNAFIGAGTTTFDGANLSGIAVSFSGNNTPRDDSWAGVNFSGATINASGNQPFVSTGGLNLQDANFSGTTFNFTNASNGAFGFNAFGGDVGSNKLAGADFTNSVWNFTGMSDGDPDAFNIGAGSTSAADSALAADFSGADFSGVTDSVTLGEIITNLGESGAGFGNGAFYDANTVLPTGFTTADLDAAGWQNATAVPEPTSLVLLSAFGGSFLLRRRRRG